MYSFFFPLKKQFSEQRLNELEARQIEIIKSSRAETFLLFVFQFICRTRNDHWDYILKWQQKMQRNRKNSELISFLKKWWYLNFIFKCQWHHLTNKLVICLFNRRVESSSARLYWPEDRVRWHQRDDCPVFTRWNRKVGVWSLRCHLKEMDIAAYFGRQGLC